MHDRDNRKISSPQGIEGMQRAIATAGVATASSELPHREKVQAAFGKHDLGGLRAACSPQAGAAATAIGAEAYALGDRIALGASPSLHVVAHEAAHYVQQQRGAGASGAALERHADLVGEAVVEGRSAEALLDRVPASSSASRPDVHRTDIGGYDTRAPSARTSIMNYLWAPQRSYQELQSIREALRWDRHDDWEAWVQVVDEVIAHWQKDDIQRKRDGKNWATSTLYSDDQLVHLDDSPVPSGLAQTSYSKPEHLMETDEIEVSAKDSEVEILERLHGCVARMTSIPSTMVLKIVSTNGPCDGCKGRLSDFANQILEAIRQRGWSYDFQLTIEYRYLKPPKHTTRHLGHHPDRKPVETTYGSFTDLRVNGSYLSVGDYRFDPIAEGTLDQHMDVDEDSSMDIDEDEDMMEVETATATYTS